MPFFVPGREEGGWVAKAERGGAPAKGLLGARAVFWLGRAAGAAGGRLLL